MSKGNVAPVRAFVFDLDGTLIDSKMDLVHSVNAMLRETGRAEQPIEQVASYIGHGAPQLIASVLGLNSSEEQRREGLEVFLRHYQLQMLNLTRPYPGVAEGLRALTGCALAVLTNKPTQPSIAILEGLKLRPFFRAVYGGDSFEKKKPDPAGALAILRELNVSASAAAMVGAHGRISQRESRLDQDRLAVRRRPARPDGFWEGAAPAESWSGDFPALGLHSGW